METERKVGLLTGGGDAPGLNAVIRAVVQSLARRGIGVVGFHDGFEGLVHNQWRHLDGLMVDGLLAVGGTMLGTTNRGSFAPGHEDAAATAKAIETFRALGLECVVCVGGDGTMAIAHYLSLHGLPCVGIPKTIDNDLRFTDQTFGFDTAVAVVTQCLDRLHTTAASHRRIIVVEVMGRNAGWIALHGGLAGGAGVILIPEIEWSWEPVLGRVCAHMEQVGGHCLVVVAEGARLPHGTARGTAGVAHTIGEELQKLSGIDCRVTVLGHVQRGGSPTHTDRILGTKFGVVAADLVDRRDYGSLVVLRNTRVESVRLSSEVGIQRLIDVATDETVAAARATGVCFGDSGCNPKDL